MLAIYRKQHVRGASPITAAADDLQLSACVQLAPASAGECGSTGSRSSRGRRDTWPSSLPCFSDGPGSPTPPGAGPGLRSKRGFGVRWSEPCSSPISGLGAHARAGREKRPARVSLRTWSGGDRNVASGKVSARTRLGHPVVRRRRVEGSFSEHQCSSERCPKGDRVRRYAADRLELSWLRDGLVGGFRRSPRDFAAWNGSELEPLLMKIWGGSSPIVPSVWSPGWARPYACAAPRWPLRSPQARS